MAGKMKILLGYDGSTHAKSTFRSLRKAGLPSDAEAVVISIPQALHSPILNHLDTPTDPDAEVESAAEMAKQASDLVRGLFPSWEVRANVAVGSAVRNVVKKTKLWGPDLLVLGLDDSLAEGRNYFGGISHRIAAKVPCSVHMARELTLDPDETPRVLLCVDDSERADVILAAVAKRTWLKGTELRILTAVDPFDYSIPELLDNAIDEAKARQRVIANELSHTPAFTSTLVREGEASRVILAEAAEWHPDAIFLVPRRHNLLRRLLLSSVSSRVVARAKWPVELVRSEPTRLPKPGYGHIPATSPAYD